MYVCMYVSMYKLCLIGFVGVKEFRVHAHTARQEEKQWKTRIIYCIWEEVIVCIEGFKIPTEEFVILVIQSYD